MKKIIPILFLLTAFPSLKSFGQIGVIADRAYVLDTLRNNSYSAGLSFLFYVSDNEMKDYTVLRLVNSAHFNYVFTKSDIDVSLRQTLERQSDGERYSNNLLLLSSGIRKYKPVGEGVSALRKFYVEPLAIYQNNSDHGLRRRFQVGALVHPWGMFHRRLNLNVGVGVVYDWSSWEVNDAGEIADASPELREKIEFVNARVKLRKDMYQDHAEWRPMALVTLNYRLSDIVGFTLNTAYQQSLVSPYSKEIRDVYPDLGKVHAYILTQFDVHVKLYKGLSMSLSTSVDYENNNLSLYKSSWSYSTLVGFSWTFSNQRITPPSPASR